MKKILPAIVVFVSLASACKKTGGGSAAPIATESDASAIFGAINLMYNVHLEPALTKKVQTYSSFVLTDSSGNQATVNGSYATTNYSGSSGSVNSATLNVTIDFKNFSFDGLVLNGTLTFYDTHETRTDCSGGNCATASSKGIDYKTADTTAAAAVAVRLTTGGRTIGDNIDLVSSKSYSTFSVTLINADRTKFRFSY